MGILETCIYCPCEFSVLNDALRFLITTSEVFAFVVPINSYLIMEFWFITSYSNSSEAVVSFTK